MIKAKGGRATYTKGSIVAKKSRETSKTYNQVFRNATPSEKVRKTVQVATSGKSGRISRATHKKMY